MWGFFNEIINIAKQMATPKHPPLYKYLKKEHARNMMIKGEIYIGCLSYYRDIEDEARADRNEGKKIAETKFSEQTIIHNAKGDIAFTVKGPARSLLMAERLILNCMQRMSGIATQAYELTALCKGTRAKVIDTRKTTPGIRLLEKWAVVIGGATNYRWGLYDMILIKDNHVECAGGVKKALDATHAYLKKNHKKLDIVIEADSMAQVKEVLAVGGVNRILLDNFSPKEITKAVKLINGKYKTEASGGITKKNIREYAETGVDYISVGALTHSVKSLDMSLKIFPNV